MLLSTLMTYIQNSNKIILENIKSFNIQQILECGQAFRFNKIDDNHYVVIAFEKALYIKQKESTVEFYPCNINEFEDIWIKYFDLNRDYCYIKEQISKDDAIMQEAISFAPGIRLLNQDSYECLISFIISQNNHIPRIKQIINNLSCSYGKKINDTSEHMGDYYSFPTYTIFENLTNEDIMACKTGFRAKYIKDACNKIASGHIDLADLVSGEEIYSREKLMSIHGVGQKVSDCVLLFSLEKYASFPIDVWVKRVMEELYFDGKPTAVPDIHAFAKQRWGQYGGFAQQYLFYYAKEKKIGTKKEEK